MCGYVEGEAVSRGLSNRCVITQGMNVVEREQTFDRIVSVEMFGHVMNWRELMTAVRSWLAPDGRLFHAHLHASLSHPAIGRHTRCRDRVVLVRHVSQLRRMIGSTTLIALATRSKASCVRSMDAPPHCGCGAGAGSSSLV
ncbi:cyclopropane-fatty-acyl-phospholipid synthase family protein [Tardiphaga sp.]|uniref:SAM-dependent methyltransferase n=1 Tax=Tardiphaga sp. TaxID=1926292 RepID=UPI00352A1F15